MDTHEVIVDPVIVHPVLRFPFAIGHGANRGARFIFTRGKDALDRSVHRVRAIFLVELADACDAGAQASHLGVKVAHHRFRRARIDPDDAQQFLVGLAAANDLLARDHDAFLVHRGGIEDVAGILAAHVGPVRAHHCVGDDGPVNEDRRDQHAVIGVGAAPIRHIHVNDVARIERTAFAIGERLANGIFVGAEEQRQASGIGEQI